MSPVNNFVDSEPRGTILRSVRRPGKRDAARPALLGAFFALLLFMVIYSARPADWIPGLVVIPLAKISGFLALAALVSSIWNIRQGLPREIAYLALLTAQLFAAAFFSSVWKGGAVQQTFDFCKVLLIVIVIALSVRTTKRLRLLIFVQAVSVAAVAGVTVWKGHFLGGDRLEGLLGSYYSDPNDLALTIVIALPLSLALLLLSRGWLRKSLWTSAMLTMIYTVFLTGSRGGFIALAATAAVVLWEFGIQQRRYYLIVLAVLGGIGFWQLAGSSISARLGATFDSKSNTAAYASSQARQQLFWKSIDITLKHPLFGVGAGNFQQLSGLWHETHNSFTQMSSEGGIPALILYVLILGTGFQNLRTVERFGRVGREVRFLAAALRASLVGFMVGSVFLSVAYLFFPYFLIAYTSALVLVARKSLSRLNRQKSENQHSAAREGLFSTTLVTTDFSLP